MKYTEADVQQWIRNPAKPTIPVQSHWAREHWIEYLIKTNEWTVGAELGVWKGRTFLYLLNNCPHLTLHGVDLWAPQPNNEGPQQYTGPNWNHGVFEKAVRAGSSQFGQRAIIHKMLTHEASKLIEDNSLDFVFIDADHSAEAVRQDIIDWSPKIKNTGWVLGHDINWPPVREVVEDLVPGYVIGPDNTWGRLKRV